MSGWLERLLWGPPPHDDELRELRDRCVVYETAIDQYKRENRSIASKAVQLEKMYRQLVAENTALRAGVITFNPPAALRDAVKAAEAGTLSTAPPKTVLADTIANARLRELLDLKEAEIEWYRGWCQKLVRMAKRMGFILSYDEYPTAEDTK